jgi:glycosyltransferase involved in cell wall biosynthesis
VVIDALRELEQRQSSRDTRFAIHVFGKITPDDRQRIEEAGLGHLIREHASVGYKSVLQFMKAADILYLPSGGDVAYALPFKVFDYLKVRRPALAVTSSGSALAQFVTDHDCGEVVSSAEPAAIADAIERILRRKQEYSYRGREKYTWASIASQYDQLIREIVKS